MAPSEVLTVVAPVAAVVGILLVVSLATGGRRTTRIVEAGGAHRAIRDADITFSPADTTIGSDGGSALIADATSSAVAIAYVVGDRIAARTLRASDVQGVDWLNGPGGLVTLRIRLADFGCPALQVRLPRAEADRWRPIIDALSRTVTVEKEMTSVLLRDGHSAS